MKIKKDDMVTIISGKDAGSSGKVVKAMPKKNKILVEGLNKFVKHVKKQDEERPGGIVEVEKPINISKVKIKEPSKKVIKDKK